MSEPIVSEITDLKEENIRLRNWIADLQSGFYINCVYCGHRYGPDDEVPAAMADVLMAHIEQCSQHPMSALKKTVQTREVSIMEAREREAYLIAVIEKYAPAAHQAIKVLGLDEALKSMGLKK